MQEAFYVMMEMTKRLETHLRIARLLQQKGYTDQDSLFTIAHHYTIAADLVAQLPQNDPERVRLLEINFEAAKRAKLVSFPYKRILSLTTIAFRVAPCKRPRIIWILLGKCSPKTVSALTTRKLSTYCCSWGNVPTDAVTMRNPRPSLQLYSQVPRARPTEFECLSLLHIALRAAET